MRKVVLPRCKTIGDELARIRDIYPKGKKGPGGKASGFFRDAEQFTGLKKNQVLNYITISTGWHRLVDFMADLPEGAAPIQSMRGALEVLRAMNRPAALLAGEGAVDVEAVAATDNHRPAPRQTGYAISTREKVIPALEALRVAAPARKYQDRLDQLIEALELLLNLIDQDELATPVDGWDEAHAPDALSEIAAPPPRSYAPPQAATTTPTPEPVATPETDEPEEEQEARSLPALYPKTQEGLEALEAAIAEHGSGAALGRTLGLKSSAVKMHRRRIRQALGLA
jgi:hypothetical protein